MRREPLTRARLERAISYAAGLAKTRPDFGIVCDKLRKELARFDDLESTQEQYRQEKTS